MAKLRILGLVALVAAIVLGYLAFGKLEGTSAYYAKIWFLISCLVTLASFALSLLFKPLPENELDTDSPANP